MAIFTPFNAATDPNLIAQALLPTAQGLTIDLSSLVLVSGPTSAMFYDGSLGALGIGPGLLLTSGTTPGTSNTVGYFGIDNGMEGDPDLTAVVSTVFNTVSLDATTLSFSFNVTDPTMTGVSFNLVFGSDEFPEWVNQFVDIGVVLVNGVNIAYFNHDPHAPLSVIGSNLAANYFINNTGNLTTPSFGGAAVPGAGSPLPIEYDGVSAPLTVFAPVHLGLNTIKIGIADTRDHIYDSGLFISNMQSTTLPVTGMVMDRDGTQADDSILGSGAAENIQGFDGNDDLKGAGGDDIIQAGGGDDSIQGGSGNDYVDGGAGIDQVTYAGHMADYSIWAKPDGSYRIVDLRAGSPDGSDTLLHVESIAFADAVLDLSTLQVSTVAPSAVPLAGTAEAAGGGLTVDAFAPLDGVADPALLSVVGLGALPAGVSFDPATHIFSFDPADPAYVSLGAGQQQAVVVSYQLSDGTTLYNEQFQFQVIGVNDAPLVSGPGSFATTEFQSPLPSASGEVEVEVEVEVETEKLGDDGIETPTAVPNSIDLRAHATDPDTLDALTVVDLPATLPDGITYIHKAAAVTFINDDCPVYHPAVDLLVIHPKSPAFDSLAEGEVLTITIDYGISDGHLTTPTQAIFTITGTNDAPVVSADVTTAATEDATPVTLDALANATDIDHGTVLSVTDAPASGEAEFDKHGGGGTTSTGGHGADDTVPEVQDEAGFTLSSLPPGVTFDAATHAFTLDPTDAAFQSLSAGEVRTVTIAYGVTDGLVVVPAQAVFTVTGTNDAPIVSGAVTLTVTEDGGAAGATASLDPLEVESLEAHGFGPSVLPNTLNLLGNATDIDHLDTLSVVDLPATLPPGITHVKLDATTTNTGYYGAPVYHPAVDALVIDPSDPAFQSLAEGEVLTITVAYGVSDGTVTTPASAVFTVIGSNDAPVVSGSVTAMAIEDGASVAVDALALATDIDHGAVLSVTGAPPSATGTEVSGPYSGGLKVVHGNGTADDPAAAAPSFDLSALPAGVQFDAATNSFTLNASDPAYQHLAAGQVQSVTVLYGITDGIATTAASAVFTVIGTNDAPVVSGPASLSVTAGIAGGATSSDATPSAAEVEALEADGLAAASIPNSVSLLAHASDVDDGSVLSVVGLPASLPAGISHVLTAGYFTPSTIYYGAPVYHPPVDVLVIDPSDPAFASLAKGEVLTITVEYAVSDGTVTTPASAVFTITGTNDAPVVAGVVSAAAAEDAAPVTIDALAQASDIDHGAVLSVTGAPTASLPAIGTSGPYYGGLKVVHGNSTADDPGAIAAPPSFDLSGLPAGVHFDAATNSFTLDASDPAYQHLSLGQVQSVTVLYGITDGIATTAASAVFTVTGTNDAPVVSGPLSFTATEDGLVQIINPLANASDVDQLDVLSLVPGDLPDGLQLTTIPGGYYQPDITVIGFNPGAAAFQSLAVGEVKSFTWNYAVTDGHTSTAASASFTVTGVNDAPIIATPAGGTVLEDGAGLTVDALAHATDADHGAVLSVVGVPAILPAGITYDAASHSFSIDPTNAVFQALAQGETQTFSVAYGVTDGMVTTPTSVQFTVVGVNDAPVISGPVTGTPTEDGQIVRVNAAGNATDVDAHQGLQVTGVPSTLPPGVSYDAATQRFSLDPSDAAYQHLARGESQDVTVAYNVFDGYVSLPTAVIFTISGRNDTPVVSGVVQGGTVSEDAGPVALNLLAKATDADTSDVLSVKLGAGAGVTASVVAGSWTAPVQFSLSGGALSVNAGQFGALHAGEVLDLNFSYIVTDGDKSIGEAAGSAHLTILGANDAPTGLALSASHVAENSLAGTVVGQFAPADADRGDSFVYQLMNDPSGFFAVAGDKLVVAAGAALDFETTTAHVLDIKVTDVAGASFERLFTIGVDNVAGVNIQGSSKADLIAPGAALATTGEEDTVDGGNGNDSIDGGGGSDLLSGGSGDDSLAGGAGNDTLTGGVGNDIVLGGDGNDRIMVSGNEAVGDQMNGGAGTDTFVALGNGAVTLAGFNATALSIEVWEGNGRGLTGTSLAELFDLSGITTFTGSGLGFLDAGDGNDTVFGSGFADDLRGAAGNDVLKGGAGNDTIDGGAGNDTIFGDAGNDQLRGSAGADSFVFNRGGGQDTILDFVAGTATGHDLVDLDVTMFSSFAAAKAAMVQTGADVTLTAGADVISFKAMTVAALVAGDFIFH